MRKIICSLLMALLSVTMFAADIIVTTKSEKLEVKILEISSTEIRYKKTSNLEGPTFVISTNDVNTILFENGEVQVIEHAAPVQPQTQQAYPQTQQAYPQTQPYGYSRQPAYGQPYGYPMSGSAVPGYIMRQGEHYSINGQPIVLQDFLYANCPVAYDYWRKNLIMESVGWGALGAGIPLFIWGACILGYYDDSEVGIGLTVAGAALLATGVPLATVGHIRRARNSVDIYNQQCAPRYSDVRVDLQASQNGIGLAFAF